MFNKFRNFVNMKCLLLVTFCYCSLFGLVTSFEDPKNVEISKRLAPFELQQRNAEMYNIFRKRYQQSFLAVDLCFLVDITGSMGSYIAGIRSSILAYAHLLSFLVSDLRLCFVGYRDCEDKPRFEVQPFTTSVSTFYEFLTTLHASGGGDYPEDVIGGLQQVLARSWNPSATKLLFHIADAPGHPFPCCRSPEDTRTGVAEDLIFGLWERSIRYNFGEATSRTLSMTRSFERAHGAEFSIFDLSSIKPDNRSFVPMKDLAEFRKYDGKTELSYKFQGDLSPAKIVGEAYFGAVLESIHSYADKV